METCMTTPSLIIFYKNKIKFKQYHRKNINLCDEAAKYMYLKNQFKRGINKTQYDNLTEAFNTQHTKGNNNYSQ